MARIVVQVNELMIIVEIGRELYSSQHRAC